MENNKHYIQMPVQPIELMQSVLSKEEFVGYLKGNMIKYSVRAGHKEGESAEKDKQKYFHYKRFLLAYNETGNALEYEPKQVIREG